MITASYKLTWQGDPYKRRLLFELQRAVRQGAERVRRNAVSVQLNTSGQAVTNKYGANRGDVKKRFANPNITNLKTVNGAGRLMLFGGTFTFKGKSGLNKNRTYSVDRIYWYGKPLHRWVQSSPPGTPPHKQTGTLQRSIAVEVAAHGLKAKVGPGQKLKYARIQELGGKGLLNLPPRPYMRPALMAEAQRIMFGFQMAITRASK